MKIAVGGGRSILLVGVLFAGIVSSAWSQRPVKHKMTSAEIDGLWKIGDPVAGEKALRDALQSHPESADEIHTQIARALGLQRKFKEASAELARVSGHAGKLVAVRVELESGRIKNTSGERAASVPHFLKALALARASGFDFYEVDAAHMLGIVTDGGVALDWNEKALAMAAASKDERAQKWKGSLLNNIGWTYYDMGQFEKALARFKDAVPVQEKFGNPQTTRIAKYAVAKCLRSLKRYQEALEILNDLIKFPEAGYVSEEMGEDLLALGRAEEAKPHFRRAFELLGQDPDMKQHEPDRLSRLQRLGNP